MKAAWTMLANYAEENSGLLYIQGGTWDTITVGSPLENGPPDAFTLIQGFYIARLEFHQTETEREHEFEVIVVDQDGGDIGKLAGRVNVPRNPSLPATWNHPVNLIVPLNGLALPAPGPYRISLLVDGQHSDERNFRVIKGF